MVDIQTCYSYISENKKPVFRKKKITMVLYEVFCVFSFFNFSFL